MRAIMNRRYVARVSLCICALAILCMGEQPAPPVYAQTTNITSSGLNTAINHTEGTPTFFIDGGTRPGGGPNLFHSFGQFSIGAGDIALFRNSDGATTSNIFGRVTGNSVSNIFGTIDTATNFSTANLWLINPNGFLFGPTASLNVGGSVNISTADYLNMTDGTKFNALPGSADALLSMAPVEAFGFLERPTIDPTFGRITVRSSDLRVQEGQALSLIGKSILIEGKEVILPDPGDEFGEATILNANLSAPAGRLNLVAVGTVGGEQGQVILGGAGATSAVSMTGVSTLGPITIDYTVLDTSGRSGTSNGGAILIRGGEIVIKTSPNIFLSPISGPLRTMIRNDNLGNAGKAGPIDIQGGRISITSVDINADMTGLGSGSDIRLVAGKSMNLNAVGISTSSLFDEGGIPPGGNGGEILVKGSSVMLDRVDMNSSTSGTGNAGSIRVMAEKDIFFRDGTISSFALHDTTGAGGDVSFQAQNVSLSNASIDSRTAGDGKAGTIRVTAAETFSLDAIGDGQSFLSASSDFGLGKAGDIIVEAKNVKMSGGASIISENRGRGLPGNIVITTTKTVSLSGVRSDGNFPTDISASAGALGESETAGAGGAGSIRVDARMVILEGGAQITNGSLGQGAGGLIQVSGTEQVTLRGSSPDGRFVSGLFANTEGQGASAGKGGNIEVRTPILNLDGGRIESSTLGQGLGGAILITGMGSATTTISGGTVQAQSATAARAGDIDLRTEGNLNLQNTSLSVNNSGGGNAGSITLRAGNNLFVRNSQVSTESDLGSGGNIKLTAPNTIFIADSTLTSSVQGQTGSNGGNISIDPVAVAIQNSQILAQANQGAGGNINIVASGAVLVSPSSVLDASAGPAGVPGRVNIDSPIQVLGGTLVPLKVSYSQAALSGDRCAADPQGRFSSFVQTGRDGVPPLPGAYAPSPLFVLDRLLSSSRGSQLPNLTAARLGLDRVEVASFHFQSACRS